MNEAEFHKLSDSTLNILFDALEEADEEGLLDAEFSDGSVFIALPGGKQFIVSKHAPSRQLWLSSPISGGLHFGFDDDQWKLADGRTLSGILSQELQAIGGIMVNF